MNFNEFQPGELEFFAESEYIEIIPSFHYNALNLISGDFGPFRPSIPIRVPLWLGIYLKRRLKCKVNTPDWLTIECLTYFLNEEKNLPENFIKLPYYFEEMSSLIIKNANEDIKDVLIVRRLIEDILNLRWSKLQEKLTKMKTSDAFLDLSNMTSMELNKIKRSVEKSFTCLQKINSLGGSDNSLSTSNSQAYSNIQTQSGL